MAEDGAAGTPIVSVQFNRHDVFDLDDPSTSAWPYRWANALHIEIILRGTGFLNPVSISARPTRSRGTATWQVPSSATPSTASGGAASPARCCPWRRWGLRWSLIAARRGEAGVGFGVIVFAALGVLLWVLAVRAIRLRVAMKRWPARTGVVRHHRTRGSRKSVRVDLEVSYRFGERDHLVWCTSPTGAGSRQRGARSGDSPPSRRRHGGGMLSMAATLVLLAISDLPEELITGGSFLLIAVVLRGWAVSTGIAAYGARRSQR